MNLTNPTQIWPDFWTWGLAWPDFGPWGPDLKTGRIQFGLIKYIIFKPFLRANPIRLNPKIGPKIGLGLAALKVS